MDKFIDFVQNFIWTPIVGAIIGFSLGLVIPKIATKIYRWWKSKISRQIREISIAGDWNSFFHEEKSLQMEKIHFEQIGQEVTGTISMQMRNYNFIGTFKNQILLGTYESTSLRKDERGTIVLRYINENLLSGYCTFIYKNRQVYNSPYVLSSISEHRVDKGTYQFCNSCVGRFDCCCNCEEIDMPILLPFEVETIMTKTKKTADSFSKKLTAHLYQMKRRGDKDESECIFFVNNKCSIYEYRPLDCRMFPFDFREINGEYWVVYYNKVCHAIPTEKDEIDVCAHNMRPLLEIMLPYMSECLDPVFNKRLQQQNAKKLFPVDKIVNDQN